VSDGLKQRVYFEKLSDVGWRLAIVIDEKEIGQSTLNQMLLMAMIPIVGLVLATWSLIIVARYMRRITTKVNEFAMSATNGSTATQIDVTENDEFGVMENQLNIMVSNMETMRKESEERLELAQEASRAKSDFLSRMSHEIRTPMNAIIGMTQIAKNTSEFLKAQECLDRISSASKLLLSLINDILDMSKIEANKLEIQHEEFDFDDITKNIETIIDVKVKEKKQTLLVSVSDNVPQKLNRS
jgi:Signal transduction histidine kinase